MSIGRYREARILRSGVVSRRVVTLGICAAGMAPLLAKRVLAQAKAVSTLKLGDFDIRVISDGTMTVPTRFLASNVEEGEIMRWLASNGQAGPVVMPPANVTLVRTPSELILIDVGGGSRFMPTLGKLIDNLQTAGFDPKAVNKVVVTHAHPDHLWGVLDDFDELAFPNATFLLPEAEWNFWMAHDALTRMPEDRQNFVPGAQRSLTRIRERLQMIKPGSEIASGIRAIDTAGHTPGHIAVEIASGRDAVIVLADALTHPTISFAHPEWTPAADHFDSDMAVRMRVRLLDRLASDRSRIIGYHLPYPGIGTVERSGNVYRFATE